MHADHNSCTNDRRRILAPRTSEDEALFIAKKYLENKAILEAKLANAVNGGRYLRQNMLDVVAAELSAKFNVANRNRKYVEQKLRDMKKEARKYLNMSKSTKVLETGEIVRSVPRNPPEPIKIMMEAMAADEHLSFNGADTAWTELDFLDTIVKGEGSEGEDDYGGKSPNGINSDSVASTSSSSSIDMGTLSTSNVLGIDSILGAYFGQPMLAAMAGLSAASSNKLAEKSDVSQSEPLLPVTRRQIRRSPLRIRRRQQRVFRRPTVPRNQILAVESFRRLCDTLLDIVPRAAKSFETACKLQSEYFEQLRLQMSLVSFASQMNQANNSFRSLS